MTNQNINNTLVHAASPCASVALISNGWPHNSYRLDCHTGIFIRHSMQLHACYANHVFCIMGYGHVQKCARLTALLFKVIMTTDRKVNKYVKMTSSQYICNHKSHHSSPVNDDLIIWVCLHVL